MRVKGMDHIVLAVRDIEASIGFYQDVLGMEVLRLDDWRAGKVGFPSAKASAGTIIDLQKAKEARAGQNLDHFCLEIEPTDLEALAADLVRRGVTVDGTPGRRWGAQGYGRSLYVRDPDGNKVELKCYGE